MGTDTGDLTELKELRRICCGAYDVDLAALAKTRNTWADISVLHKRSTTRKQQLQLHPQMLEHEPQLEVFEEISDEDTIANSECRATQQRHHPKHRG